jgi:hypothetical protein
MNIVKLSNLPEYLQFSAYANQFDNEIFVQKKYIIKNLCVDNDINFKILLDKLRYWGVNTIPFEIAQYTFNNPDLDLSDFKDFFHKELSFFKICREITNEQIDINNDHYKEYHSCLNDDGVTYYKKPTYLKKIEIDIIEHLSKNIINVNKLLEGKLWKLVVQGIKLGNLPFVKFLNEIIDNNMIILLSARFDHIHLLEYLQQSYKKNTNIYIACNAHNKDTDECLKYVLNNPVFTSSTLLPYNCKNLKYKDMQKENQDNIWMIFNSALRKKSYSCMKYIYEIYSIECGDICMRDFNLPYNYDVKLLKFICEFVDKPSGHYIIEMIQHGLIDNLKFLINNYFPVYHEKYYKLMIASYHDCIKEYANEYLELQND